jgi:hypothetical protein
LDKGYRVKPLKITREKVIFKDCHGEGNPTFQHKNKIMKKITISKGEGKEVTTFNPNSFTSNNSWLS